MTKDTLYQKHAHGLLKAVSADRREFTFVANRYEVDRDSEVVVPSGLDVSEFQRNPVLLTFHDHQKIAGRVVALTLGAVGGVPAWVGVGRVDPPGTSAVADEAYGRIQSGSLNGISIGFLSLEASPRAVLPNQQGATHTRTKLLEVSLVAVPSCANCLVLEKTLRKETAMTTCNCQRVIDWASINNSASAIDWSGINASLKSSRYPVPARPAVDFTEQQVKQVIAALMPAFQEGMRSGLKLMAGDAARRAVCRMTGRLD